MFYRKVVRTYKTQGFPYIYWKLYTKYLLLLFIKGHQNASKFEIEHVLNVMDRKCSTCLLFNTAAAIIPHISK